MDRRDDVDFFAFAARVTAK